MQSTHRALIVDDHAMVRKGLLAILKNMPGLELVGEARDGREAIDCCGQLKPDVVLMDLVMPELGGVAATRAIHQRWPTCGLSRSTSFQERELVQDALQAGAARLPAEERLRRRVGRSDPAGARRPTHPGAGGGPGADPAAGESLQPIRWS